MSDLASVIVGNPDDTARIPQLRQGIVTATAPLTVRVGAATTSMACRALASYVPTVGDCVSVLVISGDRLVLGKAGVGTGVDTSQFVLKSGDTMTGNLYGPGGHLNFGGNAYGGAYRGVNYDGQYLIMTDTGNTFISAPANGTSQGTVFIRGGINNSGAELQIKNDGNHNLNGALNVTGRVTATDFNLSGGAAYYFSTYSGGWYMSDTTWLRSWGDKGVWLGGGWYGTNGGMNLGGSGATGNGVNEAKLVVNGSLNGCAYFTAGNIGGWPTMPIVLRSNDPAGGDVGISGWVPSNAQAPIWRFNSGSVFGESWDAVASNGADPVWITAYDFYVASSTVRVKTNITDVDDDELLGLLSGLQTRRWLSTLRPRSAVVAEGDLCSEVHDCAVHPCQGDADTPCLVMRNFNTGSIGVTAEDVGEIFPESVALDHEGLPTGLGIGQVAMTALGAVGALVRRLAALEQRLADLEVP